jgi:hypothetical protein
MIFGLLVKRNQKTDVIKYSYNGKTPQTVPILLLTEVVVLLGA